MESQEDSDILELYGCDDNPLFYMIEPKGSVITKDKDHETTVKELQNIIDWDLIEKTYSE